MDKIKLLPAFIIFSSANEDRIQPSVLPTSNDAKFMYSIDSSYLNESSKYHNQIDATEFQNAFNDIEKFIEKRSGIKFIQTTENDADFKFSFTIDADTYAFENRIIVNTMNSAAEIREFVRRLFIEILGLPRTTDGLKKSKSSNYTELDLNDAQIQKLQSRYGKPHFLVSIETEIEILYRKHTWICWLILVLVVTFVMVIIYRVYRKHSGHDESNFFQGVRKKLSYKKRRQNSYHEPENLVALKSF